MNTSFKWRIAMTEGGLTKGSFYHYKLPVPSTAPYVDHSAAVMKSDGSQALHGFEQVTLLFDILSGPQAAMIRQFIDAARSGAGILFMTIDKGDGSAPGPAWIDISGTPHRQARLSQNGPIVGSTGQPHYTNVQLFLNNVTVVNDPSNYSRN
jgi:hypothetical protein